MVRQGTLTPSSAGSSPAIPASCLLGLRACLIISAPLAQSVEHLPFKQGVRGSNPRRGTKSKRRLWASFAFAVLPPGSRSLCPLWVNPRRGTKKIRHPLGGVSFCPSGIRNELRPHTSLWDVETGRNVLVARCISESRIPSNGQPLDGAVVGLPAWPALRQPMPALLLGGHWSHVPVSPVAKTGQMGYTGTISTKDIIAICSNTFSSFFWSPWCR